MILHNKNSNGTNGTGSENGFIGVCEAKVLHAEDNGSNYPSYAYLNSYTLLGHHHNS